MFEDLDDNNWMLFAAKAYDKPGAIQSEFEEDVMRLVYIKRLLSKYYLTGDLKERLILNHIIILYNVFGIEASVRMLFLKLEKKDWTVIKPFLVFLNALPEQIQSVRGVIIDTATIAMDEKVIEALRALEKQRT